MLVICIFILQRRAFISSIYLTITKGRNRAPANREYGFGNSQGRTKKLTKRRGNH